MVHECMCNIHMYIISHFLWILMHISKLANYIYVHLVLTVAELHLCIKLFYRWKIAARHCYILDKYPKNEYGMWYPNCRRKSAPFLVPPTMWLSSYTATNIRWNPGIMLAWSLYKTNEVRTVDEYYVNWWFLVRHNFY